MPRQFRFSIPNLPKEIWLKFQELRKAHGLTQQQCIILGILAICDLGAEKPERVDDLVKNILKETQV